MVNVRERNTMSGATALSEEALDSVVAGTAMETELNMVRDFRDASARAQQICSDGKCFCHPGWVGQRPTPAGE